MDTVMARGRWAQARTARIYAATGLLNLTESNFSSEVEAMLSKAISRLRFPSS